MSAPSGRGESLPARIGRRFENVALVVLLTAMLLLAVAQILLRNLTGSGPGWADEALRLLVLWVGMFGALAASRDDRQLRIDLLSRYLSPGPRRIVELLVHGVTAVICAMLAWQSWRFVTAEAEYGATLFNDLPAWPFQIILPLGFALLAWRHTVLAVHRLRPWAS
jgi:TRAP-type C4-dicarboxylate transport system permease small subunit